MCVAYAYVKQGHRRLTLAWKRRTNSTKKKTVREAGEKVAKKKSKPLRLSGSGAGAVAVALLLLSFMAVADISVCAYDDEQERV